MVVGFGIGSMLCLATNWSVSLKILTSLLKCGRMASEKDVLRAYGKEETGRVKFKNWV